MFRNLTKRYVCGYFKYTSRDPSKSFSKYLMKHLSRNAIKNFSKDRGLSGIKQPRVEFPYNKELIIMILQRFLQKFLKGLLKEFFRKRLQKVSMISPGILELLYKFHLEFQQILIQEFLLLYF